MKIRFRDLRVKDPMLKKELLEAVDRVLSHGRILLGPEVTEFEERLAEECGKKFAVGLNSGTDSLYLALRVLNVGPGDEVITTPLSWIATTNTICLCGATPVFVDIGEDLNINPDLIEKAVTPRTKAVLPVHFTGKLCGMEQIVKTTGKHSLYLVEDAAQAYGAGKNGSLAGSFGHVGCFSMNPMKVLCAYGEAGACVTDDEELYEKLRSVRYAGTVNREDCQTPALNGKIDTIQAAMMLVNMKYVNDRIIKRTEIAKTYQDALKDVVGCPQANDTRHVYYSYTIIAERRDELAEYLARNGIETKIQHPILMPYHTAYKGKYPCNVPTAERLVKRILCLPNEESLTRDQVEYIAEHVVRFYGS